MSTWTAPITWANAAVTAAQMNAEIRDHANFLKGFADLITNSTTADTGTATYLSITRTSSTDVGFRVLVTGDTQPRIQFTADGQLSLGPGGSTVPDSTMRRVAAKNWRGLDTAIGSDRTNTTDIALQALVTGDSVARLNVLASGAEQWSTGAATADVQVDRSSAGVLRVNANGSANTTVFRAEATAGQLCIIDSLVAGDTASRIRLRGDATVTGIEMSSGSASHDVNLYRSAANYLTSDDKLRPASFKAQVKAGAPVDGDITGGAESGDMVLDTTNSKIYFQVAPTRK